MHVFVILGEGEERSWKKLTAGAGQMTESHAKGTNWPVSARKDPIPSLLALENMYGPLATTDDRANGKHLHNRLAHDVTISASDQSRRSPARKEQGKDKGAHLTG